MKKEIFVFSFRVQAMLNRTTVMLKNFVENLMIGFGMRDPWKVALLYLHLFAMLERFKTIILQQQARETERTKQRRRRRRLHSITYRLQ